MEITPFTVAVPRIRSRGPAHPGPEHALAVGCRDRLEPRHADLVRPWPRRPLGRPVRLARAGGSAQRVPAVQGRCRRPGDPLRPRALGRCRCHSPPPAPRLSELVRRGLPADRPARRSGGARRTGGGRVPRGRAVAAGVRVLDASGRSRLGNHGIRGGLRPDHAGARLRALRRERRRHRCRRGRAAVHPGRRPRDRVAGGHRSGGDRDGVHAADRPPDRRGEGAPAGVEGGSRRGLRVSPAPDDPPRSRLPMG